MKQRTDWPPIILASNSPRRQQLLKEAGFQFEIKSKNIEEVYPENLQREEIPLYLSHLKASSFQNELSNEILIAADTVVFIDNQILGKPTSKEDAATMLRLLSSRMHEVITGVTLLHNNKIDSFYEITEVYFSELSAADILFYLDTFQPYDKAGAYGIQEWIGIVGIEKINGCFYNVMGLPVNKLIKRMNILAEK